MIAGVLATVLAGLGVLHLYWAAGGTWGVDVVVPQVNGRPMFRITAIPAVVVALGLFGAATVAVLRGFFLLGSFPGSPAHWASEALAGVFFFRAIGDFQVAGFFKRVRGTPFATWDSRLFSPLCLLLSLGFLLIAAS